MKNLLPLLLGLFPLVLHAQLRENFTHSQFPDAPTQWRGHTFAFGINEDSLLQSQTMNTTYISTENQLALGVVWEFGIRLAFNPSPQNQLRVYLIADRDTLTSPLNGYFIQIGENGATDRYYLYRQQGEQVELLLSSSPKNRANPAVIEDRIKVLRDSTGHWELFTAIDDADEFSSEGVAIDSVVTQTAFFGIHCRFTSANSDKFHFHYFSIEPSSTPVTRIVPPKVSSIEVVDDTTLHVIFDHLLDRASATDRVNYMLSNGYDHPVTASLADTVVTLVFGQPFITSDYTLTINNVVDTVGNTIAPNTEVSFSYIAPEPPEAKLLPDDTDGAWFYDGFDADRLLDHWRGDTASFEIVNERVRINDSTISPVSLSTSIEWLQNTVWEVGIQVNGTLSSNNYVRWHLSSTNDSLRGSQQGYHLQIDGSRGYHVYHLWRQNGASRSRIFQSNPIPSQQGKFRARVRVTRDNDANWRIFADEYDHGVFEPVLGIDGDSVIMNDMHMISGYMGYSVSFTPTRRGDYIFDYLLVKPLHDIEEVPEPLSVTSVEVLSDTSLTLVFNSWLAEEKATDITNYVLDNGYGHPFKASLKDSIVTLVFDQPLISSGYTLTINNVADTVGNTIAPNTEVSFSYIAPEPPEAKLLPDDTAEAWFYDSFDADQLLDHWRGDTASFEIVNERVTIKDVATSPAFLSTQNNRLANTIWEAGIQVDGALSSGNYVRLYLTANNDSLPRPQTGYQLQIDGARGKHVYKLVRQTANNRYTFFLSDSVETQGKFRARVRVTRDNDANWRIYTDEYDSGVFRPILRHNGDSTATDGTHNTNGYAGYFVNFSPTRRNAYKFDYLLIQPLDPSADPVPDSIPPSIISAAFVDSLTLHVIFDKFVDALSAADTANYSLHGVHPQHIETTDQEVTLTYADSFDTGEYSFSISNIKNKDGFAMGDTLLVLQYTKTHTIQPHDIIINEILPYPKPDGVDFLEIYNRSNKIVDLRELYAANVNSYGAPGSLRKVSDEQHLFYPGEYRVLTTNRAIVKEHYPTALLHTFIEMATLPNFNNETGGVILSSHGLTIDSLFYTPAMQSPFISNHRGISLERSSFEAPTLSPGNFRSAATSIGGATPGYLNSHGEMESDGDAIFLTSKTFSPDGDGFEDLLEINYRFHESGLMANIDIYNDQGLLIRRLQRNQSLATQGVITWDGLSDTNQRLPIGIYIAVIDIYNAHGMRKIHRKSFVLAAKM